MQRPFEQAGRSAPPKLAASTRADPLGVPKVAEMLRPGVQQFPRHHPRRRHGPHHPDAIAAASHSSPALQAEMTLGRLFMPGDRQVRADAPDLQEQPPRARAARTGRRAPGWGQRRGAHRGRQTHRRAPPPSCRNLLPAAQLVLPAAKLLGIDLAGRVPATQLLLGRIRPGARHRWRPARHAHHRHDSHSRCHVGACHAGHVAGHRTGGGSAHRTVRTGGQPAGPNPRRARPCPGRRIRPRAAPAARRPRPHRPVHRAAVLLAGLVATTVLDSRARTLT